ncbi:MAG: DUF4386 family protein [Dehalococcoidia bacterium]
MRVVENQTGMQTLLRIGAAGAVLGTIFQVAAGSGSGSRPDSSDAAEVLRWLADQPGWYWPSVYFGFIFGALFWVGAFVAIAATLRQGPGWALSRLAVAAAIAGVAMHIVDGSISGVGLRLVADDWAAASGAEQAAVLRDGETLLAILEGTWASVIMVYHGLPFILMGLAVVFSQRYPAWLGWVGVAGGAGSLIAGVTMFATEDVSPVFFIAGALVISLFMLIAGILLWGLAVESAPAASRQTPSPTP